MAREQVLTSYQRLPPHRTRKGGAAQRLLRTREVQGQAAAAIRRHEPHQGEAGVPGRHCRGLRAARHQARRRLVHQ